MVKVFRALTAALVLFSCQAKAQSTLVYYWNFNNADSAARAPFYSAAGSGSARFDYNSAYIDFTLDTTTINIKSGDTAGSCLRARNPSNYLTFRMPSNGFKHLRFSYAEKRTNSGPDTNAVSYTLDGSSYVTTGLTSGTYSVDTVWTLHTYDLTAVTGADDNANFSFRINFTHNNTGASGNDRFDNVSLKADTIYTNAVANVKPATNYVVYPNPVQDKIVIACGNANEHVAVCYDMTGAKKAGTKGKDVLTMDIAELPAGNYFIVITDMVTGEATTRKVSHN